jgi:dephospho-CoA kinase
METQHVDRTAIFLVGMCGSGKSMVAGCLREKGWAAMRFGQITIDELEARGLPISPENERTVREEIRAADGMDVYARRFLPRIKTALESGPTVIDGLYSWSEYKYLREQLGTEMLVVAVLCARPVRYGRVGQRQERPLTAEEAENRDIAEIEKLEKGGPIAMADQILLNNGSLEDLEISVDQLLGGLGYSS